MSDDRRTETTAKPCPFCGGIRMEGDGGDGQFWLRCLSCAAEGPWARTPTGAVNDWNRRVS